MIYSVNFTDLKLEVKYRFKKQQQFLDDLNYHL